MGSANGTPYELGYFGSIGENLGLALPTAFDLVMIPAPPSLFP